METTSPLVFVTVGTDHHPFDRLIGWVDGWLADGERSRRIQCVIQCGTSHPPSTADWTQYLSYDALQSLVGRATVVVCHGGPATIMECRRRGLVPFVVPRKRELGEHVDDHQGMFTRRLAEQGEVRLISDRDDLWELLDKAVSDPTSFRTAVGTIRVEETVERFSRLMDSLVAT